MGTLNDVIKVELQDSEARLHGLLPGHLCDPVHRWRNG